MELKYNFYNSLVEKNDQWSYLFQGRANEPNVMLDDNGIVKSFLSTKISLTSNSETEGMSLLIENEPVTNYDKKLFIKFPLEKNRGHMTSLDYVLNGKSSELELNSLLPENEDVRYNENDQGIFIDFIHPLLIKSEFVRKPVVEGMTEDVVQDLIDERLGSAAAFTTTAGGIFDSSNNPVDNVVMVCDETTDGENGPDPYWRLGINEKFDDAKEKFLLGTFFVSWILLYMLIHFAADPIYHFINNLNDDNDAAFEFGRKIESGIFYFLLFLIFTFSITFLGLYGADDKNTVPIFNTLLFLAVILGFSYMIIPSKKKNLEGFGIPNDWTWDKDSREEYAKYNVLYDLFGSSNAPAAPPDAPPDAPTTG